MKFYTLFIFLLTFNLAAEATIVGQGNVEFGVSRDNEESNAGLGMRYNLGRASATNNTRLTSQMQLGSDRGRSLIATAAHEYQYENSFIDNDLYHDFSFYSPRLNWSSSATHRIEFENRVDDETGDISTNYAEGEEVWSITTGPRLSYIKGRWLDFSSSANLSRQYREPYFTNEVQLNAAIAKSVSKISQLSLASSYLCSEDDNPINDQYCRSEASIGINTRAKEASLTADYGFSDDEKTTTNIYSVNGIFLMNSTSSLGITGYRVVDSIAREEADFDFNVASNVSIKEGRNVQYLYEWSRTRLEVNARRLITHINDNSILSEDLSLFYDFQLSSNLCQGCSFSLDYEYSRFNVDAEQKISSVSINKLNSRRFSSAISFRRTERTKRETYWSLNFLIKYTGIASKISNR